MAERKKRVATKTDAVIALVIGAFLATAGVNGLREGVETPGALVAAKVALVVTGLALLTMGVIDWRTAGLDEPAQSLVRIRQAAKWSSVVALLVALWLGSRA